MENMKDYYSAVAYLESLGNATGGYQKTNIQAHPRPEMYLERMQDFLDSIGNPEKGFKYIHITGTAGKGSVSSIVHATLTKAGKKAGLFTSPFTVSTIEKIQVGEKYIDPHVFADITQYLKKFVDEAILSGRHGAPSYFELILAIAFLYFKKEKCEYIVLEVGLGGRYDATNIITNPLVTAITNIGWDHMNILGPRLEDIALDKSGIIKKNSIFFTTESNPKMLQIFKKACKNIQAEYCSLSAKGLSYREQNTLLAYSICKSLGVIGSMGDLSTPLQLPARFEIVEKNPLVIIDGAHNVSKISATIFSLRQFTYKRLILIIGISADKDWDTMLKNISPLADEICVTRFNIIGRQAVDLKLLYKAALKYGKKSCRVKVYSDPIQAYNDAKKRLAPNDALLITGSFYLAGEIRRLYCPELKILHQRNSKIK